MVLTVGNPSDRTLQENDRGCCGFYLPAIAEIRA
jgi:hypothetical protein